MKKDMFIEYFLLLVAIGLLLMSSWFLFKYFTEVVHLQGEMQVLQ